ncbi:hypothetical protein P5V15_008303 [Pogonomyrmex californicus]
MPFVMRKVEPRHVCRGHMPAGSHPGWPVGAELEAVANGALTTSLKQLASLLTVAEDIFAGLTAELAQIAERSGHLRRKIDKVEKRLSTVDPKKIPVREYSNSLIFTLSIRLIFQIDLAINSHGDYKFNRPDMQLLLLC